MTSTARWLVLATLLLSACTTEQATTPIPAGAPPTPAMTVIDGPETAEALNKRYADTVPDCNGASKPAFLCSGVIIRTTTYSDQYDSWNPSPTAVRLGAVSFAYLRKDSKFSRMPWNGGNGMLLYPIFGAPKDKIDLDVLCSFPIDGWSDDRSGNRCGEYPGYATSVPCEQQGITTAEQWLDIYNQNSADNRAICAFNVRDERNQLAGPAFYQSLLAKSNGNPTDRRFTQHNELVHGVWEQDIGDVLPIQAFFYTTEAGLVDAWKDRLNFRAKTNIDLPLIKITLPATQSQEARFDFIPADNAERKLEIDTTPMVLSGKTYTIPAHPNVVTNYTMGSNAIDRQATGGAMPYSYSSSNPAVAAVTSHGLVTAKGNGSAEIRVTDAHGDSVAYTVNVSNVLSVQQFPRSNWNTAASTVTAQGARLPSEQEAHELRAAFDTRWPFAHALYWTTRDCGLGKHMGLKIHDTSNSGMCASLITSYDVVGIKP